MDDCVQAALDAEWRRREAEIFVAVAELRAIIEREMGPRTPVAHNQNRPKLSRRPAARARSRAAA